MKPVIVKTIDDEIKDPDTFTLWEDGRVQVPENPIKEVHERVETVKEEAKDTII